MKIIIEAFLIIPSDNVKCFNVYNYVNILL